METLELIHLQNEQIPLIIVELYPGQHRYIQKNFESEMVLPNGGKAHLVFDLYYSEDVETGGGLTEEPWVRVICTSVSVENLRLEDEDGNIIPVGNLHEVERELTARKIQSKVS